MKKITQVEQVNKDNVKSSIFGCMNCLWASIECKGQEKFEAKIFNNVPSCKAYTYCD